MFERANLMKSFIAGAFIMALGIATAAEPKIKNLAEYVAKDAAYKGEKPLGKLSIIAGYAQKRRLDYNDKSQEGVIMEQVHAYMKEKGKNDPEARLKAFAELKEMNKWKQPLDQLRLDDKFCAVDFARYLKSSKAYQKGSLRAKVDFLADLIKKKMWSTPFGQNEAERVGVAYISEQTAKLSGSEKALKSLRVLAELKTLGLIAWGNTYSGLERIFFLQYISADTTYKKMSTDEKIAHLQELEKQKIIMSFLQSDFESDIVAKKLLKDKSFMAKSTTAKVEHIDTLGKERKIHTFSKSKIKNLLGLPRN